MFVIIRESVRTAMSLIHTGHRNVHLLLLIYYTIWMETEILIQAQMWTRDILLYPTDQKRKYCYSEEANRNTRL